MAAKESKETAELKKGGRSASYPYIDLETALERAGQFWKAERTAEAPLPAAFKHWGYGDKSSGARLTAAALLSFGLLSDKGAGEQRMVRLTPMAVDILMAPSEDMKTARIKEAAQSPRIFAGMLKQWGAENLPSNQTIAHYLVTQKGFNLAAAETCIKHFRATIEYAKLGSSDILRQSASEPSLPPSQSLVVTGDYVQAEIGGVLQFAQPRRVTGVSDDGQYVFVEGSSTGLPIGGITVQQQTREAPLAPPQTQPSSQAQSASAERATFKQDVYTLGSEGQVILQWPEKMSQDSYDELVDWVELQLRKIARVAGVKPKPKAA